MSFARHRLALLLLAALGAASLAYAVKPEVIATPRTKMTVPQAKKAVTESLSHLIYIKFLGPVKFDREKFTFDLSKGGRVYSGTVIFAELGELSVQSGRSYGLVQMNGKAMRLGTFTKSMASAGMFADRDTATTFVDALLTLKKAAGKPSEEIDLEAFIANSKNWLALTTRPEMPDEARGYKALAEDSFKRRNFAAALTAYGRALNLHPMWPEGHYNAALLAAETEDYELAAHHMRRYLVLASDAKDASAAKDKLLLWQLKAKQ